MWLQRDKYQIPKQDRHTREKISTYNNDDDDDDDDDDKRINRFKQQKI